MPIEEITFHLAYDHEPLGQACERWSKQTLASHGDLVWPMSIVLANRDKFPSTHFGEDVRGVNPQFWDRDDIRGGYQWSFRAVQEEAGPKMFWDTTSAHFVPSVNWEDNTEVEAKTPLRWTTWVEPDVIASKHPPESWKGRNAKWANWTVPLSGTEILFRVPALSGKVLQTSAFLRLGVKNGVVDLYARVGLELDPTPAMLPDDPLYAFERLEFKAVAEAVGKVNGFGVKASVSIDFYVGKAKPGDPQIPLSTQLEMTAAYLAGKWAEVRVLAADALGLPAGSALLDQMIGQFAETAMLKAGMLKTKWNFVSSAQKSTTGTVGGAQQGSGSGTEHKLNSGPHKSGTGKVGIKLTPSAYESTSDFDLIRLSAIGSAGVTLAFPVFPPVPAVAAGLDISITSSLALDLDLALPPDCLAWFPTLQALGLNTAISKGVEEVGKW